MTDEDRSDDEVTSGTDLDEVAHRFDRWADDYDADVRSWSYEAPEVVAGIVATHVDESASILDAGCGTGLVGQALRAAGLRGEIVGTDVSHRSLQVAEDTGAYTSVAPGDLREPLPAPDDRFDAVVCVGVMTYVPDVEALWREFARVVRPGGVVVFTQRDDVWDKRKCGTVTDRLTADGVWAPLEVTEPRPYLPGNTGGLAPVGVRYVAARIQR